MSDCDVSAGGNFTDEDYVNHLNGKLEEKVLSLEADNAKLKSENTRYEKHNKTLKNELNIWNESPVTEKVRELTAKVKELTKALTDIESIEWGYDGDHGAMGIINEALD